MITKIHQRESHDCGVACAAMLLGITYEAALELFIAEKLHENKRKPLSSKVGELQRVLGATGRTVKRKVFKDWDTIPTPCIAKTLVRYNGWHWVVIDRDPECGIYIVDPSPHATLPSCEIPEIETVCIHINFYLPEGSCLYLE
jgi:ABC-type bacteriocin/lantibiotic exporter with double-glycine peptidase domain